MPYDASSAPEPQSTNEGQPLLTSILSSTSRSTFQSLDVAREWPCSSCGTLLALLHLLLGVTLLVFDVATNGYSASPLAVSSGLAALVAALFVAIASRRLDRAVLFMLAGASVLAGGLCVALFVLSSNVLNETCLPPEAECHSDTATSVHCVLVVLSLIESFAVDAPGSPYSTLIIGDYKILEQRPLITKSAAERLMHESIMTQSGVGSI